MKSINSHNLQINIHDLNNKYLYLKKCKIPIVNMFT